MRIAIPIHSFEPGGLERVALRLAARWQASGHSMAIVLGRHGGCYPDEVPAFDYCSIPEPVPTARCFADRPGDIKRVRAILAARPL